MGRFISKEDFDATVHRDILEALTRQDDAVVEICTGPSVKCAVTLPHVMTVTLCSLPPVQSGTSLF